MPFLRVVTPLFALATLAAPSARAGVLGRGLRELVHLYESGSPNLSVALQKHLTNARGTPLVHVWMEHGADQAKVLARLSTAGFRLQAVSPLEPRLLEGHLPLDAARAVADMPGVERLLGNHLPLKHKGVGTVVSQAVAVEKADIAQARGIDGTGIRLGALSDSFASLTAPPTAAADEASGDLPPSVTVLEDLPPNTGTDEGRAMLQLAHKLAPGAQLGFSTAFIGEVDFANQIIALRHSFHADVIVDDVGYSDEPFYSDGILSKAIDLVAKDGAAYFSSAGNNGLEAYESPYHRVAADKAMKVAQQAGLHLEEIVTAGHPMPKSFHDFGHGEGRIALTNGFRSYFDNFLEFQWDEPFNLGKVKTDLNIYVFDANGHFLDPVTGFDAAHGYTLDNNIATDQPLEVLLLPVGTFQFVIGSVNDGPASLVKYVVDNGLGVSERQNSPSTFGHPAARGGQGVAAMFFGITSFPEDFSSPGPVTILFDDQGNRLKHPEVRFSPQITGADGIDTTFFGQFFGTSAAAPDVAAVAALVLQAAGGPGSMPPNEVYRRLQQTATRIPVSETRNLSVAFGGPTVAVANGDFSRDPFFYRIAVAPWTSHKVTQIQIDGTKAHLVFDDPATRAVIGETHGVSPADISFSRSADHSVLTINFAGGTPQATPVAGGGFGAGASFTFAEGTRDSRQGFSAIDGDRLAGAGYTVTLDDGHVSKGHFASDEKQAINRFAGFGLVNADLATRK